MDKKRLHTRFYTLTANPIRLRSMWLVIAVSIAVICMQIWKSVIPLFLFCLLLYVLHQYDRYFFESIEVELKLARWIYVGKRHNQETGYSVKLQYAVTDEKIIIKGRLDGLDEREMNDMTDETNKKLFQSLMQRELESYEVSRDYSHAEYKFFKEPDERLQVFDILQYNDTNRIPLTKRREWNIDESPHALIGGGTGSGKSYFLLHLLTQFQLLGADITVIDPKMADLMAVSKHLYEPVYGQSAEEVLQVLRKANNELLERQKQIFHNKQIVPPYFIVFDEYPAFLASLDRKEKAEVEKILKQIILKGRALRVFMVLGMQRADASILPADLRDQFGLRVALSRTSKDGLTMIFGDQAKELVEMSKSQQGYLKTNDMSVPVKFETPEFDYDPGTAFIEVYYTLKVTYRSMMRETER